MSCKDSNLGRRIYFQAVQSKDSLLRRVEAILRRTNVFAADEVVDAGGISVDKAAHEVKIDGVPIDLSYKEFELLAYFIENQGIALREKRF